MAGTEGTEGASDLEANAHNVDGNNSFDGGETGDRQDGRADGGDVDASFDDLELPGSGGTETSGEGEHRALDEVEGLKLAIRENYDKYLRAVAELENLKKRTIKERSDLIKYAGESLARDVVEIVDDLDRALGAENKGSMEDFLKGVNMIRDRFLSILEQHSIKSQTSLGKAFDPLIHQALASVPTADHAPGMVIQEYKKAYNFKDKLLRPGQVVVSSAPAEAEAKKDDSE